MKIDIITIFPNQINSWISEGIFRIAKEKKVVDIQVHDLRKWTDNNHKTIDDKPFGGGAGMVMMVEPIFKAITELKKENSIVVVPTPRGKVLKQNILKEMSEKYEDKHYIFLCGHYEGIDERVYEHLVDIEISIGDFVLSGGELPTLVVLDGIIRLIPNVLGNSTSSIDESFSNGELEYPQYTRPENFNNWTVPSVLLSGNHKDIENWRKEKSVEITTKRRPDLIK